MASTFKIYYNTPQSGQTIEILHYSDTLKEFTEKLSSLAPDAYLVVNNKVAIKHSAVYRVELMKGK